MNDIAITEAGSGLITISLSNATTGNVTVNYVLTGGTATSGSDYVYIVGTALITGGNTGVTVKVTTLPDTIYEGDETFYMVLNTISVNANINDSTGVVTITDNDSQPTISVNDISITE